MTPAVKQQFTDLVKRALHLFISERLSDRLKTALAQESGEVTVVPAEAIPLEAPTESIAVALEMKGRQDRIVTTAEELEAFYLVKAILRKAVEPTRIFHRDAISYFSILLDNNNRKTICRLYLDGPKKYLSFLTDDKKEERIPIASLNDIYGYTERLRGIVAKLDTRVVCEPGNEPSAEPATV